MKQVKIIQANTKDELERQMNDFYYQCEQENRKIITTRMLSNKPMMVQIVFDVNESGTKKKK